MSASAEYLDVLIVGAGLSGIGAAYHLQTRCPGLSYAICEARHEIGGTWDLFRYPGIRSDSDMFTLGYSFRPWREAKAIADGESILRYVRDTARENGIDRHVRFDQRVRKAAWSSAEGCWMVEVERGPERQLLRYRCNFIYFCSGYYRYDEGYAPALPGSEDFKGRLVHPQHWPADLDYAGKRVVIIGSGATAVTLVPAMSEKAAHVTMLQRSPTYIVSLPAIDPVASLARRLLPERLAHRLLRWKNVLLSLAFYQFCRRAPTLASKMIRKGVQQALPAGYPVDRHFQPSYRPWDQRLCMVPDADLFKAIREGRASVATDRIERFEADGIRLKSGEHLPADVVVTATGLELLALGGAAVEVDGRRVDPGQCFSYKGVMLSGVPNLAFCVGYTNASWTLRADLSSKFVCRLLDFMQRRGLRQCTPMPQGMGAAEQPLIDLQSGYIQRGAHLFPKQGAHTPWKVRQNYVLDLLGLKFSGIEDASLQFSTPPAAPAEPVRDAA